MQLVSKVSGYKRGIVKLKRGVAMEEMVLDQMVNDLAQE